MRIGDLTPHIACDIVEGMKKLAMGFKNFPFHIHYRTHGEHHRDKFNLYWTTKKEHFGTPDRRDVVSEMYCEVTGFYEGIVLLKVMSHQRKPKYLGQEKPEFSFDSSPRDWYKQEWREYYYMIEASPAGLWTIMEAHADFDRPVAEVMST